MEIPAPRFIGARTAIRTRKRDGRERFRRNAGFHSSYLESGRAYWQGTTVGTRPQRHVIVILFVLSYPGPPGIRPSRRTETLARSSCRAVQPRRLSLSFSLGDRKLLPILPTRRRAHQSLTRILLASLSSRSLVFSFPSSCNGIARFVAVAHNVQFAAAA